LLINWSAGVAAKLALLLNWCLNLVATKLVLLLNFGCCLTLVAAKLALLLN